MYIIGWMVYHVSKRASRLVLMNYLLSECQPSHNHRQAVNSRGKNLSRDTPIADLSISLTLSTEIQSSSESHPESDDRNFQFCDGVLFMWEKSWTFTDSSVYEKGFIQICRLNSTDRLTFGESVGYSANIIPLQSSMIAFADLSTKNSAFLDECILNWGMST